MPDTLPLRSPRLLLVQVQTRAEREAAGLGHILGPWEPGTAYPGGARDWWARCRRCDGLVWVIAGGDGRGQIQHLVDRCRPAQSGAVVIVEMGPAAMATDAAVTRSAGSTRTGGLALGVPPPLPPQR